MELKRQLKRMNNVSKVIISVLIGLLSASVILVIFAAVMVKNDIQPDLLRYSWLIIGTICGLTGGGVAGRIISGKGFMWGSITGLITSIIILITILLVNKFSINLFIFLIIPITLFFGTLGGIISSNIKK